MTTTADGEALLAAAREKFQIQRYAVLYAVVDGALQAEEQRVDVRVGPEKTRVYMKSAVPEVGLELDGRGRVGDTFNVVVFGSEVVIKANMVLRWFAVRHDVAGLAAARYIFECETKR